MEKKTKKEEELTLSFNVLQNMDSKSFDFFDLTIRLLFYLTSPCSGFGNRLVGSHRSNYRTTLNVLSLCFNTHIEDRDLTWFNYDILLCFFSV